MTEQQRKIDDLEMKLKIAQRERVYAQSKTKKLEEKKHSSANNLDALIKQSKKKVSKQTQKTAKVCACLFLSSCPPLLFKTGLLILVQTKCVCLESLFFLNYI